MSFRLISLSDNADIMLDKPIILVGRHEDCDVQINSRKISRKHCCIAQVNDYVVVRDLFSTNGICINGKRVEEGRLNIGDELSIAHFCYQTATSEPELAQPVIRAQVEPPAPDVQPGSQLSSATEKRLGNDSDLILPSSQ